MHAALKRATLATHDAELPELPEGAALLFPDDERPEEDGPTPMIRPALLVVPDGTWRQARRMVSRSEELRALPRLSLKDLPVSPSLRCALPGRSSTISAVAQALGMLDGPDVEAALRSVQTMFVERTLKMRGLRPGGS